jgi:hypothetical protein
VMHVCERMCRNGNATAQCSTGRSENSSRVPAPAPQTGPPAARMFCTVRDLLEADTTIALHSIERRASVLTQAGLLACWLGGPGWWWCYSTDNSTSHPSAINRSMWDRPTLELGEQQCSEPRLLGLSVLFAWQRQRARLVKP